MEIRYSVSPKDFKKYTTEQIREYFLIQGLFRPGKIKMVYSHEDRIIVGGVCPQEPILLEAGKEIGARYFLERREMGIINLGGKGKVTTDRGEYILEQKDGLYIGKGTRKVEFSSMDDSNPAKFYFNSGPAHMTYPTEKIEIKNVTANRLGSPEGANVRTIYKYIHPDGVKSCQLVMGMTVLEPNSIWNTMPCHTHDRRMEVYLYWEMDEDGVVFHLMGEPAQTRHIVVRNEEAVISPNWSIHSGVGTKRYTFIWGMVGENQQFDDMDHVPMADLR
ncbi:MAG: 5-dehydro-4-deoxy-D-glucuronate isomerase [Clostridia bacterium]|nr:5-dehydro-4-deoxy-D-glucuronate isomerase [Clostridia bacterium]